MLGTCNKCYGFGMIDHAVETHTDTLLLKQHNHRLSKRIPDSASGNVDLCLCLVQFCMLQVDGIRSTHDIRFIKTHLDILSVDAYISNVGVVCSRNVSGLNPNQIPTIEK